MSDTATVPAATLDPDADRAEIARISQVLALVRGLIAYGRHLHGTLEEYDLNPHVVPWFASLVRLYGFDDIDLILARLTRGLLRAAALQARLGKSFASLLPHPLQQNRAARPLGGWGRAPRKPRAPRWAIPPGWLPGDPSPDPQPTPYQDMYAAIAGLDRDRPIGAILLDICLDLAIVPALMDAATWDELRLAITLHGGDPAPLLANAERLAETGVTGESEVHSATATPDPGQSAITYPPWPASPEQPPPLAGGGWGRGPGP